MTIAVIALFFTIFIYWYSNITCAGNYVTSYLLLGDLTTLMSSAPQKMFSGLDNFGLLAVPLFMLAGELMNGGGITKTACCFCQSFNRSLSWWIGVCDGYCKHVPCFYFGSANAQAAMMSKVMVPEMEKEGYTREFSSAITLASSIVAPIIPPSMLFIIYGTLTGASIADLFMAGIIPGILLGIGFIIVIGMMNHKHQFPKSEKAT